MIACSYINTISECLVCGGGQKSDQFEDIEQKKHM